MNIFVENKSIDNFLTEAAEEYKEMLIEKTMKDLNVLSVDNLSAIELFKNDCQAKEYFHKDDKQNQRKRLLRMISNIGVLYMLLGVIIVLISEYRDALQNNPVGFAGIIMSIIGMVVSLLCVIVKDNGWANKREGYSSEYYYRIMLINKWNEIEGLMVDLIPNAFELSMEKRIEAMEKERLLTHDEVEIIWWLIKERNIATHEIGSKLDYKNIRTNLSEVVRIINRLKKLTLV